MHKIGTQAIANQFLQRQTQAQQNSSGAMPHYGGGAEKCARCSKSVYLAEKKVGAGRVSFLLRFHSNPIELSWKINERTIDLRLSLNE